MGDHGPAPTFLPHLVTVLSLPVPFMGGEGRFGTTKPRTSNRLVDGLEVNFS